MRFRKQIIFFATRMIVELSWTRARAFNPRVEQGWTHLICSTNWIGQALLIERIDRIRVLVQRVELNRHTCLSSTQSEFRLIQKSRIEWSTLELNNQICFYALSWTSNSVRRIDLSDQSCSSSSSELARMSWF
jgi:hypothetical protein